MSTLDRYIRKHGHYPTQTFQCGKYTIMQVQVWRGCLQVHFGSKHFGRNFYIPRSTLVKFHRWVTPLIPYMDQETDHEANMIRQIRLERKHLKTERQRKKRRR